MSRENAFRLSDRELVRVSEEPQRRRLLLPLFTNSEVILNLTPAGQTPISANLSRFLPLACDSGVIEGQ